MHDKSQTTAIGLEFRLFSLGECDTFHVQRSWKANDKTATNETLHVYKNGSLDKTLIAAWDDFIDTIIPVSIANLFFFDGEKISEVATPSGITSLLKVGIQSLLGINILNQLYDDLGQLIKAKSKSNNSIEYDTQLQEIEKNIAGITNQIDDVQGEIKQNESILESYEGRLKSIETAFEKSGARLFSNRKEVEKSLVDALESVQEIETTLLDFASSALPLALVSKKISKLQTQATEERSAINATHILSILRERDRKTLELLSSIPQDKLLQVEEYFNSEQSKYSSLSERNTILNLSTEIEGQLHDLPRTLKQLLSSTRQEIEEYQSASIKLGEAQRLKDMVPSEKNVVSIIKKREDLLKELESVKEHLEQLRRQKGQLDGTSAYRKQERDRILRLMANEQKSETVDGRTVRYAQIARAKIETLTQSVLENSREHLQSLIVDSLRSLLRKHAFISDLKIDPSEFSLILAGPQGQTLILDRLSAGERQLIVIAILWGLAKASGRPLPLIIDTPLGRLDSQHRENLLEYYLPDASHQTILLVTDTEITDSDFSTIEEFTSRYYSLDYDDTSFSSNITELNIKANHD